MKCRACGSENVIKNGGGRVLCKDCGRSPVYKPQPPQAVPEGFIPNRTTSLVDNEGNVRLQWVRSNADDEKRLNAINETLSAWAESLPKAKASPAQGKHWLPQLAACYPIGDAHIGMRSWGEETGADFDLAIAERRQCAAMDALVKGAPRAETAYIVNLGDWLHYDSLEAKTPRSGHLLDADGRYAKVVRVAVRVMRQAVESALRKHQKVHVVNAIGNHDETGAIWLGIALSQIYENEPRISVDTSPSVFRYFEHGKCLVGVHHGHTCKPPNLPGVMAADQPQAWGRTRHRYWWLGHVHHQAVKEYPGVVVESFNTLASNDAYAASGGWRSRQQMQCIVLHAEHGEVARYSVNPGMLDEDHQV